MSCGGFKDSLSALSAVLIQVLLFLLTEVHAVMSYIRLPIVTRW
jgi:hypothetical protein